jgi:hypothetical protein
MRLTTWQAVVAATALLTAVAASFWFTPMFAP